MLALVFAVALVGYSYTRPTSQPKFASNLPAPTTPLIKPEAGHLLSNPSVNLSAAQREEIARINAEWTEEKSKLLEAMSRMAPKQGNLDSVSTGLSDYSELSRTYNAARSVHYQRALRVLTAAQQKEVAR